MPSFAKATEGILHSSTLVERRRMEAGGFEPPSRDVSRQASTCLVVLFTFFALLNAKRQALNLAISGFNLTLPARTTGSASLLVYALAGPTGKVRQDGPLN